MKIVIILYIIGIITYWLGVLNFISVAKRNWDDIDESLKANAKKTLESILPSDLDYMVAYSSTKFRYGIPVYFQSVLFLWEKVKKKGSREIYCLFF